MSFLMYEVPEGKSFWMLDMTIHNISPVPKEGPSYAVKWARGGKKGKTSYVPSTSGAAIFNTQLTVPCTIIRRKGRTEEKQMMFEAKMKDGKKSKSIGEFRLNLAAFVGIAPLSMQSFPMKSSVSPLSITFSVNMTQTPRLSGHDSSMGTDDGEVHTKKPLVRIRLGSLRRKTKTVGSSVPLAQINEGMPASAPGKRPPPMSMRKSLSVCHRIRLSGTSEDTEESVKIAKGPAFEEIRNLCACAWDSNISPSATFHGIDALLYAPLAYFKVFDVSDGMRDVEFNDFIGEFWRTVKW